MIRYLILLLSSMVLSSAKCNHDKAPVPVATSETTATLTIPQIITVYITTTGAKYHNGNCRSVKKSKVSILLTEAVAKGYAPCKVCHPPVADSTASSK